MKKKIKKIIIVLSLIKYIGLYLYISLFAHDLENTIPELNEHMTMIMADRIKSSIYDYDFMLSRRALNICLNDNTIVVSAKQINPERTSLQSNQIRFNRIEENYMNSEIIFLEKLWNTIKDQ